MHAHAPPGVGGEANHGPSSDDLPSASGTMTGRWAQENMSFNQSNSQSPRLPSGKSQTTADPPVNSS
tara:strand:+ start:382 stop:582 length:201 start_codon:yes stop_codon:yes gene_type:complete